MKRIFSYIVIAVLVLPAFSYADSAHSATSSQTTAQTTPAPSQKVIIAALNDIYGRLNDLSNRTQITISQLNDNGIVTDQAEADLVNANTSLDKAKAAIDKLQPMANTDTFKTSVASIEDNLKAGKDAILTTLTDLKTALPSLDNSTNQ